MLCDEHGDVAICATCPESQIHSPYWTAAKSAALHRRGTGHKVRLLSAYDYYQEITREAA
jgi:hypothetical protein